MNVGAAERLATVPNGHVAPMWMVVLAGLLALSAVLARPVWSWAQNLDTVVHEGGHALAAYLAGRSEIGVWIFSDGSGLTWDVGRPRGLGNIAAYAAGYTGPPVVGLGSAALLGEGKVTAMLVLALLALAFLLYVVRNGFGELLVALTGVAVIVVGRHFPAWVQTGFAYFLTWFLLFSGPKSVLQLHRARRHGGGSSDADGLARLTHLPGLVWVMIFGLVGVVCLFKGASILLG
jgi:hypothetical protein